MGRTYRNKDKKFKKQLKEGRRVKKNKRHIGLDEPAKRPVKDGQKQDRMGSFLFM